MTIKKSKCVECGTEKTHELVEKHMCKCSRCKKFLARYLLEGKHHGTRPIYVDDMSRQFHGNVCPDCRTKDVIKRIKNKVLRAK